MCQPDYSLTSQRAHTKRSSVVNLNVHIFFLALVSITPLQVEGLRVQLAGPKFQRRRCNACRSHTRVTAHAYSKAVPSQKAFQLVRYRDYVELQTAVSKVKTCPGVLEGASTPQAEITLVSMVHLADQAYYREIMREASSYDRVLFELIAGEDVSSVVDGRRTLIDYVYPTREQEALASKYGLSAQLNCLNYRHLCTERTGLGSAPRWVLADLSREEIKFLQQAHGENGGAQSGWQSLVQEVTRALVVGRQAGQESLPNFFPPLGSSLNKPAFVLRALLWLAPCPEAEIMLLDWARTYPRAGGLSVSASTIAESVLAGDFYAARRLGFAQQIVSGQAAGVNWGRSDDVVVKARNGVVVEETERALEEGCTKMMVLYGGLHMQDLASQLCVRLDASCEPAGWRPAWVIPIRAGSQQPVEVSPTATTGGGEGKSHVGRLGDDIGDGSIKWGPLAAAALAYIAIGAWDWTDTVEALARECTKSGPPAEALLSAAVICALYLLRHAFLYYGLARWLVQWEKSLF